MTPDPRLGRPDRLVAVVGTGTAVGKTWVSARVCQTLAARGRAVAARKLAQSFVPGDLDARATDAHVLARATGDRPESVCPPHRWFEVPMAPPMAAQALGRPPFTVADLVQLAGEFHTFSSAALATQTLPTYGAGSDVFGSLGSVLYVQQPEAQAAVAQFLGQAPETVTTPPPTPDGRPRTVTSTTPASTAAGATTTTLPDFNPTPC